MTTQIENTEWCIEHAPNQEDSQLVDISVTSKAQPSLHLTITFHFVDGQPYEPFCNPARWKMLNDRMSYKSSDILIVSYPKCGTTWMEQIVLLLLSGGNEAIMNPANKNTFQAQTHEDNQGLKIAKIWPDVAIEQDPSFQHRMGKQAAPITWEEFDNLPVQNRVMKSHARPSMIPGCSNRGVETLPNGMKVLIVTRNPFDACVSSYFYGFNAFRNGWPFEAWASLWLTGIIPMGSWFDFTREWYVETQKHPDRTLWVHYEDLKLHPKEQIDRVARFLDATMPDKPNYDDLLNKVVDCSSFSAMKTQADRVNTQVAPGGHIDHHLRKGECGDWQNFFDPSS